MDNKVVFITGCSSGFGKLTAQYFLKMGWNVVATMRNVSIEKDLINSDNLLVTTLDVTKPETIKKAVKDAIEKFGKIDVLVNNAGYGVLGSVEEVEMSDIKHQYEVNVFGLIEVTKAVLPYLKENEIVDGKRGSIINVASMAGRVPYLPGMSVYASSKFAVVGLSGALMSELNHLKIQVKCVEPGAFKTHFAQSATFTDKGKDGYEEMKGFFKKFRTGNKKSGFSMFKQSPELVAKKIYKCAISNKTKWHYTVGKDAKMMILIQKILPDFLILKIVSSMMKKNSDNVN